jgi:hypothetical protein
MNDFLQVSDVFWHLSLLYPARFRCLYPFYAPVSQGLAACQPEGLP